MNHDPIVTHSKINSNINEASYDKLDSSSSSNEQESDNFDELEVTQEIENLDNLIEFEQNQEIESPDAEMYDNSSTSHNNKNATENNLTAHSNRQQPSYVWQFFTVLATKQRKCNYCQCIFSDKTSTSTLDQHIQTQHIGLYNNFCQTTLDHFLYPEPYPYSIQKKIAFLLKWIVVNLQAFRVVENLHFKQFIFDLDPRFKLPC
ncbi:34885_t:CDS:1 [Gigaspora margarita]|uniref:34885_t:CDS:1 n=1 Tax=Gigaspora margarita TaxID=4874 RepID=A0ABN7X2S4_GIGMA|nr:34885_t:CDS:1 [Gigaspora margarita]